LTPDEQEIPQVPTDETDDEILAREETEVDRFIWHNLDH
jgi:hypothetical protein